MKLEYRLGNVHCAGCASALEEILQKIEGVKSASLNFISNLLVLEINDHGSYCHLFLRTLGLLTFCI